MESDRTSVISRAMRARMASARTTHSPAVFIDAAPSSSTHRPETITTAESLSTHFRDEYTPHHAAPAHIPPALYPFTNRPVTDMAVSPMRPSPVPTPSPRGTKILSTWSTFPKPRRTVPHDRQYHGSDADSDSGTESWAVDTSANSAIRAIVTSGKIARNAMTATAHGTKAAVEAYTKELKLRTAALRRLRHHWIRESIRMVCNPARLLIPLHYADCRHHA